MEYNMVVTVINLVCKHHFIIFNLTLTWTVKIIDKPVSEVRNSRPLQGK